MVLVHIEVAAVAWFPPVAAVAAADFYWSQLVSRADFVCYLTVADFFLVSVFSGLDGTAAVVFGSCFLEVFVYLEAVDPELQLLQSLVAFEMHLSLVVFGAWEIPVEAVAFVVLLTLVEIVASEV